MSSELQRLLRENDRYWLEELTKPPYSLSIKNDGNLYIFKYNQINSDFSNKIVQEARGIIFDKDDNWKCVCRAFDKFFNLGESNAHSINWMKATAQEKKDGCLHCGTLILTNKGNILIEEIVKNISLYKILTYDYETEKIEESEIIEYQVKENNNDWYEIELENGVKVKLTGNHKVWIENLKCYREVKFLTERDEILFYNKK